MYNKNMDMMKNEKLKEDARLLTDTNNKLLSAYGEINKILKGVI